MFDSLIQKKREILNFIKNSMRVEAEYIAEKKVKGQNPSLIRFYIVKSHRPSKKCMFYHIIYRE